MYFVHGTFLIVLDISSAPLLSSNNVYLILVVYLVFIDLILFQLMNFEEVGPL